MQKILIVCGAGASSTFLAQRMRAGAKARSLDTMVVASSLLDLNAALRGVDVLLIGPHLAADYDEIAAQADEVGVASALLPAHVFGATGADEALDLVESLGVIARIPAPGAAAAAPAPQSTPPSP